MHFPCAGECIALHGHSRDICLHFELVKVLKLVLPVVHINCMLAGRAGSHLALILELHLANVL